jgi:hypothetical protein
VRSSIRRIAVFSAVVAASGLIGGTALAIGEEIISRDVATPSAGGDLVIKSAAGTTKKAKQWGDAALGLGGVRPGPVPAPAPGLHPENYLNAAIDAVAQAGGDAAQGLGGVRVGPIPAPAPGIEPDPGGRNTRVVNQAIVTGAKAVGNAAQGLGGVRVGPIPAPAPGIIPVPDI